MRIFDRLRPKWKHPDPAVRAKAVRALADPDLLESIAENDAHESVRLAAVEAMTDQDTLARLAGGKTSLALPALNRLTDRGVLGKLALSAALPAVREAALDHVDDGVMLHRIATSDTHAGVRAKARLKRMGPDHTRDYIRRELSRLELAERRAADAAAFCGTLDDVCTALIGDTRFRINGGVDESEPRLVTVLDLGAKAPEGSATSLPVRQTLNQRDARARFLALKQGGPGESENGSTSNIFFEIHVWRTDQDTFLCRAEEKRLKIVRDAVEWSRVANGAGDDPRDETAAPAAGTIVVS